MNDYSLNNSTKFIEIASLRNIELYSKIHWYNCAPSIPLSTTTWFSLLTSQCKYDLVTWTGDISFAKRIMRMREKKVNYYTLRHVQGDSVLTTHNSLGSNIGSNNYFFSIYLFVPYLFSLNFLLKYNIYIYRNIHIS